MEDYLGKNFFFGGWFIIFGWKNEHFSIDFNRKKNYLFNQKDNSLTFYATKEGNVFFKICHFLITGRVVPQRNFIKNFIYQLSKMEDYLGKNFFGGWIYYSRGEKWTFFDWFQSKVKNYLLIQKDNSLTFLCDKKKGTFFS